MDEIKNAFWFTVSLMLIIFWLGTFIGSIFLAAEQHPGFLIGIPVSMFFGHLTLSRVIDK